MRRQPPNGYSSDDEDDDPVSADHQPATASTPLLARPSSPQHKKRLGLSSPQTVVFLLFAFVFIAEMADGLFLAPASALMEHIICRRYHADLSDDVLANDPRCKRPDVQGALATLRGWAYTFDCIPGILGAVPYGILSDKWGRKPVLVLAVFGCTLASACTMAVLYFSNIFPLWMIWLGSLCQLIGGSGSVMTAMLYTMASDVVPIDGRAIAFMQIMAWFLVAEMVSGPLAGVLMQRSPWLAIGTGFSLLVLAILVALALPETLDFQPQRKGRQADEAPAAAAAATSPDSDDTAAGADPSAAKWRARLRHLWAVCEADVVEVYDFVLANQRVAFLLVSLVFVVLGKFVVQLLLQYATKRYGWSWDRAAALVTVRSASTLVLLTVALPAASWACEHWLGMSAVAKDLWLARASGLVQTLGALLVAFSVNGAMLMGSLVVFAAGGGMSSLVRSLASALVEQHHVGILNSLVGFMDMIGMMVAGPILAQALRIGFELGGPWVGLPFMVSALIFSVSTLILCTFRIPERREVEVYA